MPNTNMTPNTQPTSKPSTPSTGRVEDTQTQDAVKRAEQRLEAAADRATNVAVSTVAKVSPELADGVSRLADNTKQAVGHAVEQGSALAHQGYDAAVETYESTRDHALDAARQVRYRAQRAGQQTARYARRASVSTGRFATVHALPLTFVGAGLGWLAWSIIRESRRNVEFDVELETPRNAHRARLAAPLERRPLEDSRTRTYASAQTTNGNRLMGVRTGETGYETGYEEDLWTP